MWEKVGVYPILPEQKLENSTNEHVFLCLVYHKMCHLHSQTQTGRHVWYSKYKENFQPTKTGNLCCGSLFKPHSTQKKETNSCFFIEGEIIFIALFTLFSCFRIAKIIETCKVVMNICHKILSFSTTNRRILLHIAWFSLFSLFFSNRVNHHHERSMSPENI